MAARVEYLGLKVEARHLQRVLICWAICQALPENSVEYLKVQQLYRDQTMLKVLLDRDALNEAYYAQKEGRRDESGSIRANA